MAAIQNVSVHSAACPETIEELKKKSRKEIEAVSEKEPEKEVSNVLYLVNKMYCL